MRLVIFGATGNVGTAVIENLRADAAVSEIVAVARRLPLDVPQPDAGTVPQWRATDIARDNLDALVDGADCVISLAWLFHPSHRPDATWDNNVVGAARLLEAVERCGVGSLIVSSSIAAYSPRTSSDPVDESWPTHGASSAAYSREKAYVERLLDTFEARVPACRVVRMRPAFIFHPRAASQQRRLFGGPFVPGGVVRPGLVPVLPLPAGLLLQTVHADDIGRAFAAAAVTDVSGAFNLCAHDVLRADDIAQIFDARPVTVSAKVFKAALKAAWTVHAVPAAPELFDALMRLPVMSNARALAQLGWKPQVSAADSVRDFLTGLQRGSRYPTPPLDPATSGKLRVHELGTGVGSRD
jgi:nucleoside-diphosphate-sugar epimerase